MRPSTKTRYCTRGLLAVEEQFYVLFPIILIIALRYPRRVWLSVILTAFLASLALSIWQTAVDPHAAFYLAQTRVWELMLGALLAAAPLPKIKFQGLRESLVLLGVLLIVVAVYGFTSDTPFPGWAALVPCLGAALIIYAGMDETQTLVTKVLSLTPFVFVGLISYSLYLWHWPLLVFARYWTIGGLTAWQTGAIVAASVVLAILSWTYVEQPFRRKTAPIPTKRGLAGAAAAASVSLLFAQLAVSTDGFPGRLPAEIVAVTNEVARYKTGFLGACRDRPANEACVWGARVEPTFAIWGDSLAQALVPGLGVGAERQGKAIKQFTKGGCRPVLAWEGLGFGQRNCASQNAATLEILEVLANDHHGHLDGPVGRRSGSQERQPPKPGGQSSSFPGAAEADH